MVVGDEGPQHGLAGLVVVPDGSGQGQEALQDPCDDAVVLAPAVALEVEQ